MNPRLLDYYNRELAYLRELGGEFAEQFPKVASRLGMQGIDVADPYVERLLEGFAFLAARINLKFDSEFPRFSQRLLEVVYPNYLSPTPAMCIVQLNMPADQTNATDGFSIPRGTMMRTLVAAQQERTPCNFTSAHDVVIWPIELVSARVTGTPPDLTLKNSRTQKATKAAIRLRFKFASPVPPDKRNIDKISVYLSGTDELASHLYELIFAHGQEVVVLGSEADAKGGLQQHTLPPTCITTEGFGDDQAMLPYAKHGFRGHRLLHEYFAFPQRYWFFTVNGLRPALQKLDGDFFEICILLDADASNLEPVIDERHFALNCTPVVNLFPKRLDRIPITGERFEYHVVPDKTHPLDFEIFSIESVEGLGEGNAVETTFSPFFSTIAGVNNKEEGAFFSTRREPRLISDTVRKYGPRASYTGSEVFVSLVDQNEAPMKSSLRQLGIDAMVTNRDLPLLMPLGQHSDFSLMVSSPVSSITVVRGPSAPYPALAEREVAWRLISHLNLNYLTLTDVDEKTGTEALRQLLQLYGALADNHVRKHIDGLLSSKLQAATRRLPGVGPLVFGRGVTTSLHVDEMRFAGTSPFLLGAVLEQFLSRHVSINAFSELTLTSSSRGKIHTWPARFGTRPIL